MLKTIFFNKNELRNGVWIALFLALLAISRPLFSITNNLFKELGVPSFWLELLPVLFILVVTKIVLMFRKQSLRSVGLQCDLRWSKQLSLGLILGSIQMIFICTLMALSTNIKFEFNDNFSINLLMFSSFAFLCAAVLEELLFRGFIFQRLIDGIGFTYAQLLMATIFVLAHLTNPELNEATMLWATIDIGLGAIIWGMAFYYTKSLALPIGLHFSWNWMQGSIFGFNVSGFEQQGLLSPMMADGHNWLTGAGFGPEATVFAVIIDTLLLLLMWRYFSKSPNKLPQSSSVVAT